MLINNNGVSTNNTRPKEQDVATSGAKTQPESPSVSRDQVELSQNAQTIASLETQLEASADVDKQRVESIREAIDKGTYTIDAESLADKLLKSDL